MLLKSFCGALSLVSGVVILAFTLMMLAFIILLANIHLFPDFPLCLIFILVFVVVILLAGVMMVFAAYRESRKMCLVSLLLIVVLIALFLAGSGISFYNKKSLTEYVCVDDRCPESLWCASLRFREHSGTDSTTGTVEEEGTTAEYEEASEESHERRRRQGGEDDDIPAMEAQPETPEPSSSPVGTLGSVNPDDATTPDYDAGTTAESEEGATESEEGEVGDDMGYVIGPAFIIAIMLFVINLCFLLYVAVIVFSYYQELKIIYSFLHKRSNSSMT